MKLYSAIKRNRLQMLALTWVNLRSIMLSERRQAPKLHSVGSMYVNLYSGKGKTIETKSR